MLFNIILNFKMRSLGLLAMFLILMSSCTDYYDELNTPKDQISVANVDGALLGQAFAQAQWTTVAIQYQVGQNLFADVYAQYFATTHPNFNSDQFLEISAWSNIWYRDFYSLSAPQLLFVEQFSGQNNLPLENAIAKVWKVEAFHRVTDYYGPIIFSEFGNQQTSVPFDSQEDVYKSFFGFWMGELNEFKKTRGQMLLDPMTRFTEGILTNGIHWPIP